MKWKDGYMIFGSGHLTRKYSLTTKSGIILSTLLTIFLMCLFIVLCKFYNQVGIFPVIICSIFILLALFGSFLCYFNSIKIDMKKNELTVFTIPIKHFRINDINSIEVSTKNSINYKKYCHIVFVLKNGSIYKINGFLSVFKYKDVEKTYKLVEKINNDLNNIKTNT